MSLVTTDWVLENLNSLKIIDASWHMPAQKRNPAEEYLDRKSTRLNSSHTLRSRMPSSA